MTAPTSLLIAGPVQSDDVIHSHSDALAGRIPTATTVLLCTWASMLSTVDHTHMCDFWTKDACPNALLTSAALGPEVVIPKHPKVPGLCLLASLLFPRHHWSIFLSTDLWHDHAITADREALTMLLWERKKSVLPGSSLDPIRFAHLFPSDPAMLPKGSWNS